LAPIGGGLCSVGAVVMSVEFLLADMASPRVEFSIESGIAVEPGRSGAT
jgi:hypothetical protein